MTPGDTVPDRTVLFGFGPRMIGAHGAVLVGEIRKEKCQNWRRHMQIIDPLDPGLSLES